MNASLRRGKGKSEGDQNAELSPTSARMATRLRGLGYAVRKIKENGLPDSEQDGEERVHFRAYELWKVVGPEERDEEV